MYTKSLLIAAAALVAGAAFTLPAKAQDMPVRGAVMFWLLDRNNDGAIDKPEIDALRSVIFDAVDANGDGRVSKDEFVDVMQRAHGRRGAVWHRFGARDDRRGPRAKFGERHEPVMDRRGIDSPQGVRKEKFVTRTPTPFDRADEDGNGSISKSEFEQAPGRMVRLLMMD